MTKGIQQLAQELASNIKTEKDLNEFSAMLKKLTTEATLNAELREHLGFDKHERSPSANKRNDSSKKTIKKLMVLSSWKFRIKKDPFLLS